MIGSIRSTLHDFIDEVKTFPYEVKRAIHGSIASFLQRHQMRLHPILFRWLARRGIFHPEPVQMGYRVSISMIALREQKEALHYHVKENLIEGITRSVWSQYQKYNFMPGAMTIRQDPSLSRDIIDIRASWIAQYAPYRSMQHISDEFEDIKARIIRLKI